MDAALLALLSGKSQKEAGEVAGVNERTIRRWLSDEEFCDQIDTLRHLRLARTLNKMAGYQERAIDTLFSIGADPSQRGADRITALKILIEPALSLRSSSPVTEFLGWMKGAAGEDSD
jgi:hypothetical protein